jgi:hypothetical protein
VIQVSGRRSPSVAERQGRPSLSGSGGRTPHAHVWYTGGNDRTGALMLGLMADGVYIGGGAILLIVIIVILVILFNRR